jgi:large subunit ribosomal protein L25
LREKLTADVPVVITGESPAVVDAKVGTLQQLITTLRVESLPADLPAQFTVDVSTLLEIDAGIHIREIVLPDGVVLVHADVDELVVKVSALRIAEVEEVEVEAVAEGAEGVPAAEGGEPAGGEAPAE